MVVLRMLYLSLRPKCIPCSLWRCKEFVSLLLNGCSMVIVVTLNDFVSISDVRAVHMDI